MATASPDDFVHRFTPGTGLPTLTLLLLHGTGGNEDDLLPLGRMLAPQANLLSPRGKVLEHGMPRFFRRLAEGVFDLEDLKTRTNELAKFLEEAAASYRFDLERVVAIGYSNGANIAASLMLRRPGLVTRAILFRPMVPFVPDTLPDLRGTRVLVSAGASDSVVPPGQTRALVELLSRSGAQVDERRQQAGHGLVTADIETARDWLADGHR